MNEFNYLKNLEKMNLSPFVAVIDIETEGQAINSIIATIGCVIINIFTGDILGTFYIRCDTIAQQDYRTTDNSTQEWWEKQREAHPDAYSEAFNPHLNRVELSQALVKLNSFIKKNLPDVRPQVMGNGPEFDNAILNHAMSCFNIQPAWDHGCNQSLRTVVMMGRMLLGYDPKYEAEFLGIRHHALDDAKHEARYLCAIFKRFSVTLEPTKRPASIDNESFEILLTEYHKTFTSEDELNPGCGDAHCQIIREFFELNKLIKNEGNKKNK